MKKGLKEKKEKLAKPKGSKKSATAQSSPSFSWKKVVEKAQTPALCT